MPGSAKSAGRDHPRAPPFSGESAVAPHLARHQVTRDRELWAARLSWSPAARAEPRRAPSDCSAPSHTRPARPVTQPGIGGAPARPGWRQRDTGTRPSTCPFVPVALVCPTGPSRGRGENWHHPRGGWGTPSPPFPPPVRLAWGEGGGSRLLKPRPASALDKVKLSRWQSFPLPGYLFSPPSPASESEASTAEDQRPRVSPSWCSRSECHPH